MTEQQLSAVKQALELAREGVEIHNESSPEYKVCAALIALAEVDKHDTQQGEQA